MPNRPELEGKHSELPEDAELYGLGLEDDSKLGRAKLIAGVLSVVALIAMLVTSLFRAPNAEWTALLAVVTGVLIVVMSGQAVRHRADRRRRIDPGEQRRRNPARKASNATPAVGRAR